MKRAWQITVMTKDVIGDGISYVHHSITFKPSGYVEGEPPWATRTYDGAPLRLNVTKEEWQGIEPGDVFILSIEPE